MQISCPEHQAQNDLTVWATPCRPVTLGRHELDLLLIVRDARMLRLRLIATTVMPVSSPPPLRA